MISPNLPAFTTEFGSSKMESDISVSGKGRKTGSKEKPFSGVLQFKQGKKQSGQGEKNSDVSNLTENAEAKRLAKRKPTTSEDYNLNNGKKATANTDHLSSGEKKSKSEGKITVQDASPVESITVSNNSISKLSENGTREEHKNGHASKNLRGEDLGVKQPGKNKSKTTTGQQRPIPSDAQSRVEDAIVNNTNAKSIQSSTSINRSSTVTGKNVILKQQPTKPVSVKLATNTSAKNVELPKLYTPGGEWKHAVPTNRERGDSDSRVEKAVQAVKPGAKDVNSAVQSGQVINLKQSIAKGASDAVGHLENSRQPAKSTDSKINLNRSVPFAKNQINPAVEPQRVESSTNRPAKNGGQKNSKVQNDVSKLKSGVRESSSNSGFENTPSLSKKPTSIVTVQPPKANLVANVNGEVHRPLSNGSGDVQLTQVVNRDAKPSVSAEHFNTKANSNLQIPEKGNLSSKVKYSAKPNGPTTSTTRSVVGEKSHASNSNSGPVIKVLESSKTNVDKVPVEGNSPIGSKLQQEIVEFGKKLEELPVEGKRTRTQNPSISGQNVPVNADSTRTTAKRTQVIASQLVGASKIIKTIPAKRMAPKQTGLAKRDVKLEQMAKRQPGQQFSNTLGQAKSEFSGIEAASKGDDMMLAQEVELNGNTQKQNLFFGDRSASQQPTEKSINVHSDSAKVVQAEPQSSRDVPVRSDWVNRLAQAGADLESVQGKLTQGRGQTVSTAVMYREIMSAVETFRAMTNNRWSMNLEPIENLRMQLDLRMADSQLVVQARVDRAGHAFLQSGWGELQQLLADKEVDLKTLTTQSQKDGGGAKFENQGGRQSGEQKEKDESWLSRELAELIADFEKESQQPRKAMRTNRKPRMAEATFESWA